MKTFLNEFKAFIHRGNVIDLAVAVILGASFNKIVSSFVNDVLMPLISILLGGFSFTELVYVIKEASETSVALTLNYGLFIQNIVDFLIIAFTIFMVIKVFSQFEKKQAVEEEKAPTENELSVLKEIKDLLEKR